VELEINEIGEEHAEGIKRLVYSLFESDRLAIRYKEMPMPQELDMLIEKKIEMSRQGRLADMVALSHGSVIGECEITIDGSEGKIGILVEKAFQHKGVGARLLEACISRVRGTGVNRVIAEIAGQNSGAFAFFGKMGFKATGGSSKMVIDGKETEIKMLEKFI